MADPLKPSQQDLDALLDWHSQALETDPGYKAAWERAQSWPDSLRPFVVLRTYSIHNQQLRAMLRTL